MNKDLYIWWTSQKDCEEHNKISDDFNLDIDGDTYLDNQFNSRLGRSGRGRLWIDNKFDITGIDWNEEKADQLNLNDCGGIVFSKEDLNLVSSYPGIITDLNLNQILTNDKIISLILNNYKRITCYYPYRSGCRDVIYESDRLRDTNDRNLFLNNIISLAVQLGAAAADYPHDNKTSVELDVDGIPFPIYLTKYDGRCYIGKSIMKESEVKVHWSIEY